MSNFGGSEQGVVFIPMFLPAEVFNFLNESAAKRGKTPGELVNEIFFSEMKKMAENDGFLNGGKK